MSAKFADATPGTILDGELVALAQTADGPVQDFAAVRRAVFNRDPHARGRLSYVAFDVLELGGQNLRSLPWGERDARLAEAVPASTRVHVITSQPVDQAAHDAIVALGFEGTVLKRREAPYRPGRRREWLKHKARYQTTGSLLTVRQNHDGMWQALCEVNGRRVQAIAGRHCHDLLGTPVGIAYSRVDADGSLREARVLRDLVPRPVD